MRATTLTPRSWPSRPTFATSTRPCSLPCSLASMATSSALAVVVEAAAGLAPEQPGLDHAREHRWRGVERLLELLVEALGDSLRRVEPDQVGEVQRTHGVVAALDHADVDVVGRGEPGLHHPDRREDV